MINPFTITKPTSLGQWLLSSLCWTISSVTGLVVLHQALQKLHFDSGSNLEEAILFGGSLLVNVMIWRRSIPDFRTAAEPENQNDALWLALLSYLWCGALVLFQVACSLALLLWLLVALDTSPHVMWYT